MPGYAVLDLETTGFSPARGDRIVEIGIVSLDPAGDSEGEWGTLVNPQRNVGATRVHHITARDVVAAPTMAELAPQLIEVLRGRVLVAHNASFDVPFLTAELNRAGVHLPAAKLPQLCTMRLAPNFLVTPTRKLDDCCRAAGVSLVNAHSALGDARATAMLFAHYMHFRDMNGRTDMPGPAVWARWDAEVARAERYAWPQATCCDRPVHLVLRG
ncbi:PolC-type DNA polymerase III [Propionibacterium sp.]|uniref:3'-5' exonuclease n=1 Tax=Propionibacterium sp. TaxID=1977903 RepID=UPI0039E980F3